MLGRRLALTTVKKNKDDPDSATDAVTFQQAGETIVDTASGVGTVIIVVASTLTVLRVTEHIVKHICR